MINREQAEAALEFLADTDEQYAEAKTKVSRCEYLLRHAERAGFLLADGKNIEEKKSVAMTSVNYGDATDDLHDAIVTYETLKAKRETARLRWEHWRSLNSARKAGLM